jgi:hypothetical protein
MVNAVPPLRIGACTVEKRYDERLDAEYFMITCPMGRVLAYPERTLVYGPFGARAYFDSYVYRGITGKIGAVKPVEESMPDSIYEIGLRVGAEEPHELFEALRERWEEHEEKVGAAPRRRRRLGLF